MTVAGIVVFAASFMPWGEIKAAPKLDIGGGTLPFPATPFGDVKFNFEITAWNSNATLGGLKLPNWIVVLAAGGVVLMSWLTARQVWKAPAALIIGLAAYGLAHTGFMILALIVSKDATAGVGSYLTALAFVGMLIVLWQQIRASQKQFPPS
jgi:hypothetical protein